MHSRHRTLRAVVASALIAGSALPTSPAWAVTPPVTINSVISNAGTFTSSPAAGTSNAPEIVVGGTMATNDQVRLYVNDVLTSTCVVSGTGPVHFNVAGASGCSLVTPATVASNDGDYVLTADHVVSATASTISAGFHYIRDTQAPPAPSPVSASQLADDGLRINWPKASDAATGASGVTQYFVYRSQADQADPAANSYTKIATVDDTSCTGAGNVACGYDDIPASAADNPLDGKHYFYKVSSFDLAGNEGAKSAPAPAAAPGIVAVVVPPPSIVSVGGSSANPTFQPDSTQTKPALTVSVGKGGGTLTVLLDGVAVASKAVGPSDTSVSIAAVNYLTGKSALPRSHVFTATQTVGTDTSPVSNAFTYVLPPSKPSITSVSGDTTSPGKDDVTQPTVGVSWTDAATNDTVSLYADDDCAGPHTPVLVGQKTHVSGTSTTFVGAAGNWGANQLAKGKTYCLTATNTDPAITDAPTATSPSSTPFVFERAPIVSGYLLDGLGGIHPFGGAPAVSGAPAYSFDIGRRISLMPDGKTGYELDGFGGVHPFATGANLKPAPVAGAPYFGFDIARDLIITGVGKGYVLDGYGAIHAFGGALPQTSGPYFPNHDVARRIVLLPSGTAGYLLDGFGGIHGFGLGGNPKPATPTGSSYFGFDIARSIQLVSSTAGYVLDGFGGVHSFGGAATVTTSRYTAGFDIARDLDITEVDLNGGYYLDGNGRANAWGDAVSIPPPASFGPDIARDLVLFTN